MARPTYYYEKYMTSKPNGTIMTQTLKYLTGTKLPVKITTTYDYPLEVRKKHIKELKL